MFRQYLSRQAASATGLSLFMLLLATGCALSASGADLDRATGPESTASATPDNFTLPVEDGTTGALTLASASVENGSLVVRLDAAYEGIEPLGEPVLRGVDGDIAGRMVIYENNDIEVIFEGVTGIAGTLVLEQVNLTEQADAESSMSDGALALPGGLEVTFSSAGVTVTEYGAILSYSQGAPTSTAISVATISNGDTTFASKGSSTTYSAQGQSRSSSITFPVEAETLLKDPDTVLNISEVRRLVRYEIPLSGQGQPT